MFRMLSRPDSNKVISSRFRPCLRRKLKLIVNISFTSVMDVFRLAMVVIYFMSCIMLFGNGKMLNIGQICICCDRIPTLLRLENQRCYKSWNDLFELGPWFINITHLSRWGLSQNLVQQCINPFNNITSSL